MQLGGTQPVTWRMHSYNHFSNKRRFLEVLFSIVTNNKLIYVKPKLCRRKGQKRLIRSRRRFCILEVVKVNFHPILATCFFFQRAESASKCSFRISSMRKMCSPGLNWPFWSFLDSFHKFQNDQNRAKSKEVNLYLLANFGHFSTFLKVI